MLLNPSIFCAMQLSVEAQHLLQHMFRPNPTERCTTEDIMAHPWFTKNLPPELAKLNDRLLAAKAAEHAECRRSLGELDRRAPAVPPSLHSALPSCASYAMLLLPVRSCARAFNPGTAASCTQRPCHEGDGPFPHLSWTTDSLSIFAFLIPCLTHIPSPLTGLPGRRRHCRPALAARSRSPTPSVPPPAVACAERGCWRQAAGTAASKSLDALSPLSAPAYRRCGRRRPTPPHDRAAAGESLAYVGGPIATCMRRARAQPVTPRPHDL